jgi:hypothetical protein
MADRVPDAANAKGPNRCPLTLDTLVGTANLSNPELAQGPKTSLDDESTNR